MKNTKKFSLSRLPYVWLGPWYPNGHNNCRYEALLPRLSFVSSIYLNRSQNYLSIILQRKFDKYVLSRFWYPYQIARLTRKYQALFCTDIGQIRHFSGPIIVDDDDPIFTYCHIQTLNSNNVVAVVTTTEYLKTQLIKSGLIKPCHVIPSGVNLSHINDNKVAYIASTLKKQRNDIVVGFSIPYIYTDNDRQTLSNEGKLRSISFLIDVMEKVWKINPSIQLWLIGHPSRSVKTFASTHPHVRLLGYVPHLEILNYYANFNIAVYPRLIDFGGRHSIKLIEFMAAGVPIISTPVTESFHVSKSSGGIIAEGVESFTQQILLLVNDPQLRITLGQAGKYYAQSYDWDNLALRYEQEVFRKYLL